ncbi:hypothetical protein [Streptomyces sp. RO-S4]|nr:hypothetical protein [Streptomyces sp. RO-S4]
MFSTLATRASPQVGDGLFLTQPPHPFIWLDNLFSPCDASPIAIQRDE